MLLLLRLLDLLVLHVLKLIMIYMIDYLFISWRHKALKVHRFLISSWPVHLLTIKIIHKVFVVFIYALLVVNGFIELIDVFQRPLIRSLWKSLLFIFETFLAALLISNLYLSSRLSMLFYISSCWHWTIIILILLLVVILLLHLNDFRNLLTILLLHLDLLQLTSLCFWSLFSFSVFHLIYIACKMFEFFRDFTIFTIRHRLGLLSCLFPL